MFRIVFHVLGLTLFKPSGIAQTLTTFWYNQQGYRLPVGMVSKLQPAGNPLPLIVFLHGAGERGDDFHAARSEGVKTLIQTLEKLGVKQYYILIPQCPKSEKWVESPWSAPDHRMSENPTWPMNLLLKLLDSCRQHLDRVDLNRIYITGLSMGGFGTWELAQRIPDRLAAVMPICGGGDSTLAHRLKNLPVWAFHGSKDAVVLPIRTKAMGMVLKKMGAPCQISLFKNEAHGIWNRVYSNKTYVSWLLQQRRNPQGN